MQKVSISPTSLVFILTAYLCFIDIAVGEAQWASNAQGTLYGENLGDSIILQWDLNDSAAEYYTYRSTSLNGPWEQVLRTSQSAAATGGAREDLTPNASLMDLCYKVEAIDSKGRVIEFYEPICVPKFVQ
jgi:hypothetical protein